MFSNAHSSLSLFFYVNLSHKSNHYLPDFIFKVRGNPLSKEETENEMERKQLKKNEEKVNGAEKLMIPVGVIFSRMSFQDKVHFASFFLFSILLQNIN